ncbi:MAG: hypothetical protein LH606_18255 [Cytophagaceae bacterium]|nr:hypothetical protein [Cytophagaceae bacterium]
MGNAHFLITRQQYDEALAQLPDVRTFADDSKVVPLTSRPKSLAIVLPERPPAGRPICSSCS